MKNEDNENGATWEAQVNEMKRLSQRAAKLSERGAHYFVGWLISAGTHKPAMMAEFEKVLARLEKDPDLSHCWRGFSNAETPAAAASACAVSEAESIPAVAKELEAVSAESLGITLEKSHAENWAVPAPLFEEHVHEHARSGTVKFEMAPDAGTPERQGFFAKIFGKQRMAA